MIAQWAAWWAGAYLIGSIPVGLLLGRAKGVDIRKLGSGNIGATNVWRVFGARLGTLCFVLDALKGAGPTLLAGSVHGTLAGLPSNDTAWCWLGVAASAIAGHMFPVWLKFKGGKGVATGLGALLGVYPVMTAAAGGAALVWGISAALTRYVGISSCFAALSMPLWVYAVATVVAGRREGTSALDLAWPYLVAAAVLSAVVIYKHRGNIKRTLAGTESRMGQRVKAGANGKGANGK